MRRAGSLAGLLAIALAGCDPAASEAPTVVNSRFERATQIVAQWPLTPDANPLTLQQYFAAESTIDRACNDLCVEDGNDVGGGAFNLYVYASDAHISAVAEMLKRLEVEQRIPPNMRIGIAVYTDATRQDWSYRPVHPPGLTEFSISPEETDHAQTP